MPSSEDLSAVTGANDTAAATTTTVATPVVVNGPLGNSALAFTPQSFDFGTLVTNSGSATKSFTVTNTSTYTLVLGAITNTNASFTLTANTCMDGSSMPSNETCAFTVQFAPMVSGHLSGAVVIPYDVTAAANGFFSSLSVTGAGTTLTSFAGLDFINNETPTTMRLNWTDVAGAATYQVYNVVSGVPALLASVISGNLVPGIGCAAGSCSYTATGLLPSTSYTYRVLASDFLGVLNSNTHNVGSETTADFLDLAGAASAIAGACTPLTVALTQADHATPETVSADTPIAISGLGNGTIYSDNTCGAGVLISSPVVISNGSSSTTFYFKDNAAESLTISATRPISSTTKAFTINPSPAVASVVYAIAPTTAYTASSATPMTTFTAAIKDSFGNVITTNDSATVTLSLATGSGTLVPLSGTLTRTVFHGVATFDNITYTKAETITVKATENASGSHYGVTSSGIAVNPSATASVVYAVAPATTQTASSTPMAAFTAELEDAFGNVITTDSSTTITMSRVAGSGTLGGTVTKTVASGVATFDNVTYTKAETITIKATENTSGKNATSGSITVNPGAFSLSQSQVSSAASMNSGASITVTLTAKDDFGNGSPSGITSVGFTSSLVGGTGTFGSVTNAGGGVYTVSFTGVLAGSVTLGAWINDTLGVVTSQPNPATITVNPSPTIASVLYGVAPATYTASATTPMTAFTAVIKDANGNVITTNSTATITISRVAGSSALSGTLTKTVSSGVAAFNDITYTKAEAITIKATENASGSHFNVISSSITVKPSPTIASVVYLSAPATAYTASDTTPMTTFTAEIMDEYGNVITTDNATTITVSRASGTGALSGTVTRTVSSGVATFNDITYTKPETITIKATENASGSGFNVTSDNITVAAKLVFTQLSISGDTDTLLAQQPTVTVEDGTGATLTGATNSITLTAYSDSACTVPVAGAITATTNPLAATSGVAAFAGVKILKTGAVRLGASATGVTSACSGAIAIAAGAVNVAQSTVAWVPASLIADNVATSAITVTLKDANGNGVPSKTVTATSDRGADTVAGTPSSTNLSGVAQLTVKSSSTGSSNITVVGNGITLSPIAKVLFLVATPFTDYQSRLFDAISPGDNASSVKSIWKDLARSATTYDGSLINFLFDATSGWSGTPPKTYRDEVMADSPVGYWRLNETSGTTASDSTGSGNNGDYTGGYTLAQTGGLSGDSDKSVSFNGSTGYVSVPSSAPIQDFPNGITVEIWAKSGTSNWNDHGCLVSKRPSFIMHPNAGGKSFNFYRFSGGGYTGVSYSMPEILGWHHYVGRYDNSTLKIFVDGIEVSSSNVSGVMDSSPGAALEIGSELAYNRYCNITADEVAIYNTALSASRIAAHYNVGKYPDHPLVFDGSTSNSYVDFGTGVNNNANFSFETWIKPASATATGKVILSNGTTTNWGANNETDTGLTLRQSKTSAGKLELFLGEKAEQSYAEAVLTDAPVGYWKLNETSGTSASDSSGNTQTGSYFGTPTLGQAGPYSTLDTADHSVLLNGTNQYISVPNNPVTQISGSFSVTAWIKTTAAAVNYGKYVFMSESSAGAAGAHYPGIEFSAADTRGGVNGGLRCRVTYDWTAVLAEGFSTSAVNDGNWHMVGCTYDGATIRLYVDGVQNGSAAYTGGIQTFTGDPIYIGGVPGPGYYFPGWLADVALFNQKLSDARILAHYNAALKKKTCTSTSTFANNVWHFISGVFDSTGPTLKLFVDGTQECSITNAGAAYTGSANHLRAGSDGGTSNSWAGQMADLRTYGSALAAADVRNNMGATMNRFPFDPQYISGLKLWFKADAITDVTDGSSVSQWNDNSGNANHATQSITADQPVYKLNQINGKQVVRFDGTNDFLHIPSLTYRTIFVVAKLATASFPEYSGILGSDPDYNSAYPNSGYLINGVAGTTKMVNATLLSAAYRNGTSLSYSSGYDFAPIDNFWLGSFILNANQTEPAQLGAIDRNVTGTRYWHGDFAEILVYDSPLSDSDRQAVEAYLNAKYGLY